HGELRQGTEAVGVKRKELLSHVLSVGCIWRFGNQNRGAAWQAHQFPQADHKSTRDRPASQLSSNTFALKTRMASTAYLAPSATLLIMMTKLGASITKDPPESGSFTSSL